jgi:hypothetical protein
MEILVLTVENKIISKMRCIKCYKNKFYIYVNPVKATAGLHL